MRHFCRITLFCAIASCSLSSESAAQRGGQTPRKENGATPAQAELDAIRTEYKKEREGGPKTDSDAKTGSGGFKTDRAIGPKQYAPRLFALAEKYPDDPAAIDALVMIGRHWPYTPEGKRACRELLERHADSPKLNGLLDEYTIVPDIAAVREHMARLAEKAGDEDLRARALLLLARTYDERRVRLAGLPEKQAAENRKKAIALYTEICTKYPKAYGGVPARQARLAVDLLRAGRVGKPAPEIDGTDLAGARMKLSEHRGKVVLIDFWGSWCGPCRRQLPKIKALAEKFAGKPVVVLGVMSEEKKEDAVEACDREKVAWRNWLDRQSEDGPGPITAAWRIEGYPSVFVVDARGIIRFEGLREYDALERAVETLLKEMEKVPAAKK